MSGWSISGESTSIGGSSLSCGFGIAGQLAGWLLFDYFSNSALRSLIGTIGLLTALNYLRLRIWPRAELATDVAKRLMARLWPRAAGWCGLSGLASFVAFSGGIPAQIFLLPHRLARQVFVGTMSVYFLVTNVAKLPFYDDLGLLDSSTIMMSLMLVPFIPVGVYIGKWLNQVVSDRLFYHVTYSILFVMGLKLLSDAVSTWPA